MYIYVKFIYFERKRETLGEGREGGRERIPGRHHAVSVEPDVGLDLTNLEITTRSKIKSDV